ncbi:hypothetical protein [Streptomyces sp. 4N124]|uniref:hypothetical protein n=1 Tax=Streptomyces sp. 4N124 TaxID=3457420 RepID=UPI003FCF573F
MTMIVGLGRPPGASPSRICGRGTSPAWQEAELARGRGRTIVYRIGATVSSALGAAMRARLIADNPSRYATTSRPAAQERICWNHSQAAALLRHNRTRYGGQLADLFELLLGTGVRRGEGLGLRWTDVHLAEKTLLVRWNLTAVTTVGATSVTPRPRRAGTG